MRDPDAKHRESWALLLNAAATPRNGRTQELAISSASAVSLLAGPEQAARDFH